MPLFTSGGLGLLILVLILLGLKNLVLFTSLLLGLSLPSLNIMTDLMCVCETDMNQTNILFVSAPS